MSSRAFIFIGGSQLQEAAFGYASELQIPVALFDRDAAPHCRSLALKHFPVDGTDVVNIANTARSFSAEREIVGAYCNNDFGLASVATLNRLFDLPGPTLENALLCHRKDRMRAKLVEGCVAVPPGFIAERSCGVERVKKAAAELGYPVVLKPLVGSGSQGLVKIESDKQFDRQWAENPNGERVLVEKFIEGSHHDVNGLVIDGIFHPCGVADRFFGAAHYPLRDEIDISPCLPVYGVCPSGLSPEQIAAAYAVVAKAASAIGIVNSPVKADVICSGQGPVILEVAPRFHGEIVSAYMMPEATGQTPIKDWLRLLSTGDYDAGNRETCRGAAWMAILPPRGKTIGRGARQKITAMDSVAMLNWRFDCGTGSGPYYDNGDVRGLFVTRGKDSMDAATKARATLAHIFAAMAVA